jgi:hypothetical protein
MEGEGREEEGTIGATCARISKTCVAFSSCFASGKSGAKNDPPLDPAADTGIG